MSSYCNSLCSRLLSVGLYFGAQQGGGAVGVVLPEQISTNEKGVNVHEGRTGPGYWRPRGCTEGPRYECTAGAEGGNVKINHHLFS